MNPVRPLFFALAIALAASIPASLGQDAQPQKLTPEQLIVIRDRLRGIVVEQEDATFRKNTSLTDTFLQASESPRAALTFYLECVQIVDFEEEGRSGTEFRDWKERNKGRLEDDAFAKGLQILLRYLAISTEAARTNDMASVFPILTQYIDGLTSLSEPPHGVLNDPIHTSVFAKRYDLFEDLRRNDRGNGGNGGNGDDSGGQPPVDAGPVGWEPRPLNIGGMYERTILPYLRQSSPEKVPAAWTKRIDQEARMATVAGDAAEERFRTRGLPVLQWAMYVDQFKTGYEVQAVAKMLDHIDAHKATHPAAGQWVNEAIGLLFPGTDSTFTGGSTPAPAAGPPGAIGTGQ